MSIARPTIVLLAFALVAVFAFAQLFTTFAQWDDEGYFLQAYRDFLSGHILYNQVFAVYGPWTFFSAAVLAGFHAANVTHDALRWIELPVWISIAALLARVLWRWTGRFWLSVALFLLLGFYLRGLALGVGHPQMWVLLAAALLLWLGMDWITGARLQWHAFWAGAVIATIFLFKINIGVFVSVAFALAVSLQLRGRPRSLALAISLFAAAALGLALIFANSTPSEKVFAIVYMLSVALTSGLAILRHDTEVPCLRTLLRLAYGFGLFLGFGIALTFVCGTTPQGLFRGLVTAPALIVRDYHHPFLNPTGKWSMVISSMGLLTTAATYGRRRLFQPRPSWLALLKISAGTGLLLMFSFHHRTVLTGSLLFLWLLIVDVPPFRGVPYVNRLLLALLAPLFSLQLFPMAGEQVDWAAVFPLVASAILIGDGMNRLAATVPSAATGAVPRRFVGMARSLPAVLEALIVMCLFLGVGLETTRAARRWTTQQSVNLPGTHWLRLPREKAEQMNLAVSELNQNCRTVLTIPGLYSFSLWSRVPPFEEKRFNSWPFLWADDVRNNVLPKLRREGHGCVLVNREMYEFFKFLAVAPGRDDLLSDVRRTMTPFFTGRDVVLYRPSAEPKPRQDSLAPPDESAAAAAP